MKRIDADSQKIGTNPPNPRHPRTKPDLGLVHLLTLEKLYIVPAGFCIETRFVLYCVEQYYSRTSINRVRFKITETPRRVKHIRSTAILSLTELD